MKYSKLTDNQLINNIKSSVDTEDCLQELVNRHSGIYLEMIHGYTSSYDKNSLSELIKEKEYEIYVSALNFDPTKGAKFSTYLGNQTKWKCLNRYNKSKKEPITALEEQSIDFFNSKVDPDSDIFLNSVEIFSKIIDYTSSHPDDRVGKIFKLRYVMGKQNNVMPWKNISKELKMSIQGCINIHNSTIKNIKQKFSKE